MPPISRKWPMKKLSLEQEFLLIMMRLHLGLLQEDLAWGFHLFHTTVSKVGTTWTKLLSKELSCLIIWPSKGHLL